MLPFKEHIISSTVSLRTFSQDTDSGEFMWHRDREDRLLETDETDWMFQLDNELPVPLKGIIFVPAGVYHRIIKGSGNVTIKVNKLLHC